MYWSYDKSDGYALLDADGNEKPDLVDTVVRPYPERVAGTPVSYAFDDGTFTFVMNGDASDHRADLDQRARTRVSERLSGRVRRLRGDATARRALDHGTRG